MDERFSFEIFDIVKNSNGYIYYKVYINGVCQFDDFCKEVALVPRNNSSLASILSLMEIFSPVLIPQNKFRQIKGIGRSDVFEFKKDKVRVYVVKDSTKFYIIMGSCKNNQPEDIKRLKSRLRGFE